MFTISVLHSNKHKTALIVTNVNDLFVPGAIYIHDLVNQNFIKTSFKVRARFLKFTEEDS